MIFNSYNKLSKREKQIFHLAIRGFSNIKMSEKLKISLGTIETHRDKIYKKLNIHDKVNLVLFAIKNDLISKEILNAEELKKAS